MTLYEINQSVEEVLNRMLVEQAEGGEISDSTLSLFNELQLAKDEKIENTACYIKNLKAEAAAIKEEEKKLHDRRTVIENKVDRLENYLSDMLGNEKWDKSAKVSVSFRESKETVIDNETIIPKEYFVTKSDTHVDVASLRKALLDGIPVPGAHLKTNQNIQIK